MCGIFGYHGLEKAPWFSQEAFEHCLDMLSHRGPDGRGVYYSDNTGFGHRRLSILDVSNRGAQPMRSACGKVTITYNGEIYNFQPIKKELEDLGYSFESTSDTEVLLYAYMQWGEKCLNKLNGIFAFAIWDERHQTLFAARDHIGIKPFFYSTYKGVLTFSSETAPLLALPDFNRDHDPYGLDYYFTYSYIPAPYTGYKHIQQLGPGQCMTVKNGKVTVSTYWTMPIGQPRMRATEADMLAGFDAQLRAAVSRQMVSDVPLGAFLSSGVDSFAVVRAMQKNGHKDVKAFSIGFGRPEYDELPNARIAAEALGVNLTATQFQEADVALLKDIVPHTCDPFADSSAMPVYQLCQMTSEHVTVALSGDGADEMLGGYEVYTANKLARIYRFIPEALRRNIVKPLVALLPDKNAKYTLREKGGRFVFGAEQGLTRGHASWRVIMTPEMKKELYTPEFYEEVKDHDPVAPYANAMQNGLDAGLEPLEAALYADMVFYLPSDMLVKVDRMSMAHGLEVRVPLLDREFIDYCWSLPPEMKINGKVKKYILRKAISDLYPEELNRLPKSGFNVNYDSDGDFSFHDGGGIIDPVAACRPHGFGRYHQFLTRHALRVFEMSRKM
ncbi:MAG: asparagine synthase (glutamine-hydrolyzing) [Desulfovibrio sp.]